MKDMLMLREFTSLTVRAMFLLFVTFWNISLSIFINKEMSEEMAYEKLIAVDWPASLCYDDTLISETTNHFAMHFSSVSLSLSEKWEL